MSCFIIYMLPIAGLTAGPIELIFFLWTLRGGREVLNAKNFEIRNKYFERK